MKFFNTIEFQVNTPQFRLFIYLPQIYQVLNHEPVTELGTEVRYKNNSPCLNDPYFLVYILLIHIHQE